MILQHAPPPPDDTTRELAALCARHAPRDGEREPLPGVFVGRSSKPTPPLPILYEPAFVVLAQGTKRVSLGEQDFAYDHASYFFSSVALPIVGHVTTASKAAPYLGVRLALDPALVGAVLAAAPPSATSARGPATGIDVRPLAPALREAVLRLVRLADTPEHAAALAPLAMQEIVYRLLVDGQAARLRHVAEVAGRPHGVAAAIHWIRARFAQPMRIEALAKVARMSPSGLHAHFRAATGMSPLQYQKTLRLHEARRLLLAESLDAATAGFRVGYNDASQFTREYRRQFGAPPLRDVTRLRE